MDTRGEERGQNGTWKDMKEISLSHTHTHTVNALESG